MSQSISIQNVLVASSLSANVLAGQPFEFLPAAALVSLFLSATASSPQAFFVLGGVNVVSAFVIANTNRYPIRPDDGVAQIRAPAGARLDLRFLETAGATPTVNTLIDIDFIAARRR